MELFRVTHNAWGQSLLVGVAWDVLWVFMGAAAAVIVVHALYKALWPRRPAGPGEPSGPERAR